MNLSLGRYQGLNERNVLEIRFIYHLSVVSIPGLEIYLWENSPNMLWKLIVGAIYKRHCWEENFSSDGLCFIWVVFKERFNNDSKLLEEILVVCYVDTKTFEDFREVLEQNLRICCLPYSA